MTDIDDLSDAIKALFAWAEETSTDLRSTLDLTDAQFDALAEMGGTDAAR